jgi:hypothetical protein
LAILVAVAGPAQAEISGTKPLLLTHEQILALRQQPVKWASLDHRCEREMPVVASPVADYAPQAHYTATGVNNPDPASQALVNNSWIAYRAALCFLLTDDGRYARHAQAIIDAWSKTLRKVSEGQGAADFNFDMPQFIIAASWVETANGWDQTAFKTMLKQIVEPLSHAGKPNNHGDWGVLLDAAIAAYLGDDRMLRAAQSRWQELLQAQVAADGSMPLEICRSNTNDHCGGTDKGINGLSYTHFALLPATLAAQLFYSQGMDVYNGAEGSKLRDAYGRAAAWTLRPETFPYFARNNGKLNGVRNAAYFAVLQNYYRNADAAAVLAQGHLGSNNYELLMLFQ